MAMEPIASIGSQVRAYTDAAQQTRQELRSVPASEPPGPSPSEEAAEAERAARERADAQKQDESTRQKRMEANPMSWEVGRRVDTYA